MKNKKGHFDLATLLIAIIGGIIAYITVEKKLWKLFVKDEKPIRVRK
ncbi:hypothetical protein ISS07_00215 [Candidatus Woesearchaeota archaeon]|nr:hypothetical protein [Candidatus Woesearchaeota archaeon]